MIKSWKHKGLRKFFDTGSTAGIQPAHKTRLKIILQRLNAAIKADDLNLPGMDFHPLKGRRKSIFLFLSMEIGGLFINLKVMTLF